MQLRPLLLSLVLAPGIAAVFASCAFAQTVIPTTLANVQLDASRLRVHFSTMGQRRPCSAFLGYPLP